MAILGVALTMGGQQADAARGDRGPVARPQASRASTPVLSSRPSGTRTAAPASTARGGHARGGPVLRLNAGRPAASTRGERGASPREARAGNVQRDRFTNAQRGASRDRGFHRSRDVAVYRGRQAGPATRGFVHRGSIGRYDTRHHAGLGRGSLSRGYSSAMLRGPSSRFASMSACSTHRGRRICGGTRTVAMRWSGGLAPAAGSQSSCPDGTMATLAVGHENVVRCVPM